MANINVRIKRKGSSSWDDLFPETTIDQVKTNAGNALSAFTTNILEASNPSADSFIKVATNGAVSFRTASQTRSDIGAAAASHTHAQSEVTGLTAALSAKADLVSGKVNSSQIPDYLFSGLKFAGTTAGASSEDTLEELLTIANTALGASSNLQREGAYFVVTTGFTLTHANSGHRLLSGDEGDADASVPLEAGDWIVYVGYGDENSSGNGDRHEWAIINNTYQNADTNAIGVVALSDAASTTRSALSNTTSHLNVMDEKAVRAVMKDIFYTTNEANETSQAGDLAFVSSSF